MAKKAVVGEGRLSIDQSKVAEKKPPMDGNRGAEREPTSSFPVWLERGFSWLLEWTRGRSDTTVTLVFTCAFVPPLILSLFVHSFSMRLLIPFCGWLLSLTLALFALSASLVQYKREFLLRRTHDLAAIRELMWGDFEEFVGGLLTQEGWKIDRRGSTRGDGGIDLIIERDGRRWCVQCKHWQVEPVPIHPVRELYGILARDKYDGMMFFTSGVFSTLVEEEFGSMPNVHLVDGTRILGRLQSLELQLPDAYEAGGIGVLSKMQAFIERVAPPAEECVIRVPRCKSCGAVMFLKEKEGNRFWACRQWRKGSCAGSIVPLAPSERPLLACDADR